MSTVTVTDSRLVPGKGYLPTQTETFTFESASQALRGFVEKVTFWKKGSLVIRQNGVGSEFQVGGWRRVTVELS